MISKLEVAQEVHQMVRDSFEMLVPSTGIVKENCSAEEYRNYNEVIGKIAKIVMFGILEPLYQEQPGLKPPGWDD